jgi:hypothetical protein
MVGEKGYVLKLIDYGSRYRKAFLFTFSIASQVQGRIPSFFFFIHLFICAYIVWAISSPCRAGSLLKCFMTYCQIKEVREFLGLAPTRQKESRVRVIFLGLWFDL